MVDQISLNTPITGNYFVSRRDKAARICRETLLLSLTGKTLHLHSFGKLSHLKFTKLKKSVKQIYKISI